MPIIGIARNLHAGGQHRRFQIQLIARHPAAEHIAARRGFNPHRPPLRPIIRNRRFHSRNRHQLRVNTRHFYRRIAFFRRQGNRGDAVIARTIGNLRLHHPRLGRGFIAAGIFHALEVPLQGLADGHAHYAAHKLALIVFKRAQFAGQTGDADKFIHFITINNQTQRKHIAHHRQRRSLLLIRFHQTAALALLAQQRHAAFRGRRAVAFHALHNRCALLPVVITLHQQHRHILRRRRLGNHHIRAQQRGCAAHQHSRINQPRIKAA